MNDANPPVWQRATRGSRGPTPGHSRDDLAAAAVALADRGGLSAVSMRAVAGALGTAAPSLYRYVSSRDDLLDLMTDAVLGELPELRDGDPARGGWLEGLVALAGRLRQVYRRHPWLGDALRRAPAPGPHTLAYLETCLRILAPVPADDTAKFEAVALLTGVTGLFAGDPGPYRLTGADPASHPHLTAALAASPPAPPAPDLFERTLRGMLAALLA